MKALWRSGRLRRSTLASFPSRTLQSPMRRQSSVTSSGATDKPTRSTFTSTPKVEHYNFATINSLRRTGGGGAGGSGSGGRRTRARGGGLAADEELFVAQGGRVPAVEMAPDPNDNVRVYRRDISAYNGGLNRSENLPLSVNVGLKRFLELFCDFETRRCKLCNESIIQWHLHNGGIPHAGREGILLELVRPFCGTPEEQIFRWNYRLHHSPAFDRIPALSHVDSQKRKRRLQYLLRFLKEQGVLVEVFNLATGGDKVAEAARTFEFERLEFVGDGVVKYILNNVMNVVFPVREGGVRGRLSNFQFVMDGNEGLARGYDFLELQDLTQSSRVVSKFKSDVVETIFGELQFYLWATQLDADSSPLTFPFTKDIYTLRAVVMHVMYDLAIALFMYHAEYIAGMLQRVAREHQLQFIRADPALADNPAAAASLAMPGDGYRWGRLDADEDGDYISTSGHHRGGGTPVGLPAPTAKLMKVRTERAQLHGNGGAALFMESTNYDSFKRVVPIGGLLPRPFAPEQLAVIPNYMPHIQRDEALTQQVRRSGDMWCARLEESLAEAADPSPHSHTAPTGAAAAEVEDEGREEAEAAYKLSAEPVSQARRAPSQHLTVPRLKDEELIEELI